MKYKFYTRNGVFSFAILTLVGFGFPAITWAESQIGLAVLIGMNAGTLNSNQIGVTPALWISTYDEQKGGWILSLDYSDSSPTESSGLKRASRTSCWIERTSEIQLFTRPFKLGGGVGFGLWSYTLNGEQSYRGSMGFVGEIESKIKPIEISGLTLGLGYSGLSVPGTGLIDDIIYFKIRYQLFSWK